jgi:hypothetical protein
VPRTYPVPLKYDFCGKRVTDFGFDVDADAEFVEEVAVLSSAAAEFVVGGAGKGASRAGSISMLSSTPRMQRNSFVSGIVTGIVIHRRCGKSSN